MTVRGAHRLDRLAGGVGDGVLERLLLHADPRLAEHRLDERPDRARVQPAKRVPEPRGLGPRTSRGVERLEVRRHVCQWDGARVGRDRAGPELGGGIARVGVAAPGGRDHRVGQLRSGRPERGLERRAPHREGAPVAAGEGPPAEVGHRERQGRIRKRLEIADQEPALLEPRARRAERLQHLGERVERVGGGHRSVEPLLEGYTRPTAGGEKAGAGSPGHVPVAAPAVARADFEIDSQDDRAGSCRP